MKELNLNEWKKIAIKLWEILDDISTVDDWAKSNDSAYRKAAGKLAEKRSIYLYSPDGYKLEVSEREESK